MRLALLLLKSKGKPIANILVVGSSNGQLEDVAVYPDSTQIHQVLKGSLVMLDILDLTRKGKKEMDIEKLESELVIRNIP